MLFTLASYNILADAYVTRERYPLTPEAILEPAARREALLTRLVELDADVLCLQEVERAALTEIAGRLTPLGYQGLYAQKAGRKPDGCATFYRSSVFGCVESVRYVYADDRATREPSVHVAQLLAFEHGVLRLGVANTHLQWDPPGTPAGEQRGYRQAGQLLEALERELPGQAAWIVCGDLNAPPDSELVRLIEQSGFARTHSAFSNSYTFSADGLARTIDHLFYSAALRATPLPLPAVDAHTPLPGADQPSDHVAVAARFGWAGEGDSRTSASRYAT